MNFHLGGSVLNRRPVMVKVPVTGMSRVLEARPAIVDESGMEARLGKGGPEMKGGPMRKSGLVMKSQPAMKGGSVMEDDGR